MNFRDTGVLRAALISLGFLLGFGLLVELLLLHKTVPLDRTVDLSLDGLPGSVYLFFSVLCRSGNVEIELPILLVLGWRFRKRYPGSGTLLLFLGTVFASGTVLEHFLKMHLPPYTPPEIFQHDPLTGWEIFFPMHVHVISSFPSGHTFRALLILLLARLFYPAALVPLLLWSAGIIVGVIALGWHWSSDTLGSVALVGAVWPWARLLEKRISPN